MDFLAWINPPPVCNKALATRVSVDGILSIPCGKDYVGAPGCGAPYTITYGCPTDIVTGCPTATAAACTAQYNTMATNMRSAVASDRLAFQALTNGLTNACRCYASNKGMTYIDPTLTLAYCPICKPSYAALGPRGCNLGTVNMGLLGPDPMCTCNLVAPCAAGSKRAPGSCIICISCLASCCKGNRCVLQPVTCMTHLAASLVASHS